MKKIDTTPAVSNSVYAMDLMLKEIDDKLETYRKGKENLEDYEIRQTLNDHQRGYKHCLENMKKYIKDTGMWQERLLRS